MSASAARRQPLLDQAVECLDFLMEVGMQVGDVLADVDHHAVNVVAGGRSVVTPELVLTKQPRLTHVQRPSYIGETVDARIAASTLPLLNHRPGDVQSFGKLLLGRANVGASLSNALAHANQRFAHRRQNITYFPS